MKRTTIIRRSTAVAAVLTLSLGFAACSDDAEDPDTADDTASSAPAEPTEEPETGGESDIASQVFGDACSAIPTDGKGSLDGMVTDPVATAASNNPLLSTLVTAVGAVPGLADTLNGAEALTVFAPTNDAFAAIPEANLDALLADKKGLTDVLTYHVVAGQLSPEDVVGDQTTLQGGTVTVEGDESGMTVNGANVVCGNIPTANATVYVIDTVLTPA